MAQMPRTSKGHFSNHANASFLRDGKVRIYDLFLESFSHLYHLPPTPQTTGYAVVVSAFTYLLYYLLTYLGGSRTWDIELAYGKMGFNSLRPKYCGFGRTG